MSFKLPTLAPYWEEEKKRKRIPRDIEKQLWIKSKGTCMWCRKQPVQEFHHIDGNPRRNKPDNIIALCGTCHNRAHNGEITKEQLWKRLGVKKRIQRVTKKRHAQRKKPRTPIEALSKHVQKDFGLR
jgi:5-methylcytosine-specific restriction endonuclease McrA